MSNLQTFKPSNSETVKPSSRQTFTPSHRHTATPPHRHTATPSRGGSCFYAKKSTKTGFEMYNCPVPWSLGALKHAKKTVFFTQSWRLDPKQFLLSMDRGPPGPPRRALADFRSTPWKRKKS